MKKGYEEFNKHMCEKISLKKRLNEKLSNLKSLNEKFQLKFKILEEKENVFFEFLKKKHNQYQEAKGNIRVFCRVKPILSKELNKEDSQKINIDDYLQFKNNSTFIIHGPEQKSNTGKSQNTTPSDTFTFDRIFTPKDDQEIIFSEISQLVQSAMDGYKICIFAYGQTGSGKTYTMEGETLEKRGLIPRSLEKIFNVKSKLENRGWNFKLEASCFEIYIDQVRDLLSKNTNNIISNNKNDKTLVEIKKIEDFQEVLACAANKRVVAETNCNEKSSRSHFIFQVKLTGRNPETGEERNGALNLIDLAGSERIAKSKVEDER